MHGLMKNSDRKEPAFDRIPRRQSEITRTVIVGGREISLLLTEDSHDLTISGTVNSYYQKQMALKLIFDENSPRTINDRILVNRKQPELKGNEHD
tara:strand:+ start:684 stop:968 length:285 start_codon:yes stop_codon:yes gene_type:complete